MINLSDLITEEHVCLDLSATDKTGVTKVKKLPGKEADINTRNNDDNTHSLLGIHSGSKDVAEVLLENGADINVRAKRRSQNTQKAASDKIGRKGNLKCPVR